mmetsp:Transcript_96006/g.200546  ORF Transcript_96006/g.200546 Transcript_96006/m.200546 type:complete len:282 (-) Transcript_96006:255-1100(-)
MFLRTFFFWILGKYLLALNGPWGGAGAIHPLRVLRDDLLLAGAASGAALRLAGHTSAVVQLQLKFCDFHLKLVVFLHEFLHLGFEGIGALLVLGCFRCCLLRLLERLLQGRKLLLQRLDLLGPFALRLHGILHDLGLLLQALPKSLELLLAQLRFDAPLLLAAVHALQSGLELAAPLNGFVAAVAAVADAITDSGRVDELRCASDVLAMKHCGFLACASSCRRLIATIRTIAEVVVDNLRGQGDHFANRVFAFLGHRISSNQCQSWGPFREGGRGSRQNRL